MSEANWLFNIHDETQGIVRKLATGLTARVFAGENVMLSVVRIEPHSTGAIHSHPEEQWGLLLEGECLRLQGEQEIRVQAGDFWHTPGGLLHGLRTEALGAIVLDIFSPPRPEYRQAGEGFASAVKEPRG